MYDTIIHMNRSEALARIQHFYMAHDKSAARELYYEQVIPNPAFSNGEADRLAYKLGVIDEGETFQAQNDYWPAYAQHAQAALGFTRQKELVAI